MTMDISEIAALAGRLGGVEHVVVAGARGVVGDYGNKIEQDAKALAPVRTGDLQGSIVAHQDGLRVEVEAGEYYGRFNEYGTSRMPPTPFMEPALAANEDGFATALEKAVETALNTALGL